MEKTLNLSPLEKQILLVLYNATKSPLVRRRRWLRPVEISDHKKCTLKLRKLVLYLLVEWRYKYATMQTATKRSVKEYRLTQMGKDLTKHFLLEIPSYLR